MMKTPSLVDNSFSRRDIMPSFDAEQQRSCDQWQLWARESRTVNKMTSFHSRSTRRNLLQDEALEPAILKHMMQHRDSSSTTTPDIHHLSKKTKMDKQQSPPQRRCPRPSHSFHSGVDRKSLFNHDLEQRSFKLPSSLRSSERFLVGQVDRPQPLHHEAESSDIVRTGSQRRRRRADIAVEQEPTSYGNNNSNNDNNKDDCCLEYTHSMILQQEAILEGIRREERKQEAIRKKLLQEEALRAAKNKNMTEGHGFLSTKKPESLSLTPGRHQQSHHSNNRRAIPTPVSTPSNHSSPVPRERAADFSSRNQQQQQSSSSSEVIRVHGRRVKVYSETRVQDAMERGDSVFLLRCIECNKQLLATKDLTMIFCSGCKSLFPTQLGKEVRSTKLPGSAS